MNWAKEKPTRSGWYQYADDLYPIGEKRDCIRCDPACRVAVHSGEEPFIAIYQDTRLYDYERADGVWSSSEETLERSAAGELPDE
ncbi:MAG: hypothetical protein ABSH41_05205 [Syntrophobacteraceae bacterium]